MTPSTSEPAGSATPDFTTTGANDSRQNRTREMQLIPEALARAHMHERLQEAERERRAVRLVDRPPDAAPGRARLAACPPRARHGGHAVIPNTPEAVASGQAGEALPAGAGPSERIDSRPPAGTGLAGPRLLLPRASMSYGVTRRVAPGGAVFWVPPPHLALRSGGSAAPTLCRNVSTAGSPRSFIDAAVRSTASAGASRLAAIRRLDLVPLGSGSGGSASLRPGGA